jgi:tetratricopeptide (TPR) repeat protein
VGGSDIEKSMSLIDAAIAEDPTFARAHSLRAALLYYRAITTDSVERADEVLQSAVATANYALELAPQLGEPYFVLAKCALVRGELNAADQMFRDALARAPNNADGRDWYGAFLLEMGYLDRGWAESKRAAELDPLSASISVHAAFAAVTVGQLDFVSEFTRKSRENGWPGWAPGAIEGAAAMQRNDMDAAEAHYKKALPNSVKQVTDAFDAIRAKHISPEFQESLDTLPAYGPPGVAQFGVEVNAGHLDAAFSTVWSDLDSNSLLAADGSGGPARRSGGQLGDPLDAGWWFQTHTEFRKDPRFAELVQALGLVAFWKEHGWPDLCQPADDSVQCR